MLKRFTRDSVCIFIGLIIGWCASASASDETGEYQVMGMGSRSCGWFVSAHDTDEWRFEIMQWILGYLTAFNVITPNTYSIQGNADTKGLELWISNYCQAHPLESIATAA